MKFLRSYKLEGEIKLLSGLHIGGNKDKIEIGGIDSPVIKHPISSLPYIPGSSIKGKMRFLMEWALGKVDPQKNPKGEPHSCDKSKCEICRIFGSTDKKRAYGPTRLKVNDCEIILTTDEEEKYEKGEWSPFDEKVENSINRLTGTAIHPRHIERVVSDSCFKFNLIYNIFEIDENDKHQNTDEKNWDHVLTALYLLQEDTLGGSGSRGYGRIKFENLKFYKDDILQDGESEIVKMGKKIQLIPMKSGE